MNLTPYKGRVFELDLLVDVYKNLHNNKYSIKQNNIVIGHSNDFYMMIDQCKVSESGRQRVIQTKQKNAHAVLKGRVFIPDNEFELTNYIVSYNPYFSDKFYVRHIDSDDKHKLPWELPSKLVVKCVQKENNDILLYLIDQDCNKRYYTHIDKQ